MARRVSSFNIPKPLLVYGLITLAVMAPLLLPGHLFTLDMVFTPRLPMPEITSSSFLFRLVLYIANVIIPSEVIEKLLYISILLVSGLSMHRLVGWLFPYKAEDTASRWGQYVAGILYMVNPFTYSRLMTGQYSVLLGYALLPFFAWRLLIFLAKPKAKTLWPLIAFALAISIFSLHTIGLMAVFTFGAVLGALWRYRRRRVHLKSIVHIGAMGVVVFTILSSYWLVPFLSGSSAAGQAARSFTEGDMQAYATVGANVVEKIGNVLRLQGFWAEKYGMYLLPQDRVPAWGLISLGVWIFIAVGARRLHVARKRYELFVFGFSGLAAIVLSVWGVSNLATSAFPSLGGFREPHKFVGLLCMVFAAFISQGIPAAYEWAAKRKRETTGWVLTCVALVLPVAWTPTMFWGFNGQLSPREYPASWFQANNQLNQDTDNFQVLFLPWHQYMHFRFAGRNILNPAAEFFDKPTIASNDPEFAGSSVIDQDPLKVKLSQEILPHAEGNVGLDEQLADENIKYILFAREHTSELFNYFEDNQKWQPVFTDDLLVLYKNLAWRPDNAK
jgi:hypothetical protein